MGGDLVSWIFYSPRRLALVGTVVLLGALALGGLLTRLPGAGPDGATGAAGGATTGSTASVPALPGASTGGPGATAGATGGPAGPTGPTAAVSGSAAVPDVAPFVTAAVRFTDAWGSLRPGETSAQWHDRVDPLVTADLAAALKITDPASLPGAHAVGEPSVRYLADSSALVAVPLSNGSTVLVTVISLGTDWQVSDIQPDVGDLGDVGGAGQAGASATGPAGPPGSTTPRGATPAPSPTGGTP